MEYTDDHRLLLQCFLSRKFLSHDELQRVVPPSLLPSFMEAINARLKPMFLQVQEARSEDGIRYWGLVNQKHDAASEVATAYSPAQLGFFLAVVRPLPQARPLKCVCG